MLVLDMGVCDDISWEKYHWGYTLFGVVDGCLVTYKYVGNGTDVIDIDECVAHFKDHFNLGGEDVELS